VKDQIRAAFGEQIYDMAGELQRAMLREIVFASEEQRKKLEAILHPAIRAEWMALAQTYRLRKEWLVVDIPLLFETQAQPHFDAIAVVACSEQTQLQRMITMRNLDESTARRIMAAQLDMREKITHASHVIWNDAGPAMLLAQADALAAHLSQRFS